MKKYFIVSVFTLPLSFGIVLFFEVFMGMLMGGVRTVIGFPIPYYIDEWFTAGIELNQPLYKYLDILIFYFPLTIIGMKLMALNNKK